MALTYDDLHDCFSRSTLSKAKTIQRAGKILELKISQDNTVFHGKVLDPNGETYRQQFDVLEAAHGFQIDGLCSCTVGFYCKHIAALLLETFDRAEGQQPKSNLELRTAQTHPVQNAVAQIAALKAEKSLTQSSGSSTEATTWMNEVEHELNPEDDGLDHQLVMLYVLDLKRTTYGSNAPRVALELRCAYLKADGSFINIKPWEFKGHLNNLPPFAQRDSELLRTFLACRETGYGAPSGALEDAPLTIEFFKKLLNSGRCYWANTESQPLKLGVQRRAKAVWRVDDRGVQRAGFEILPPAGSDIAQSVTLELPLSPPWFVDLKTHELGVLETGLPARLARTFLATPPVTPAQLDTIREDFVTRFKGVLPIPGMFEVQQVAAQNVPHLTLHSGTYRPNWGIEKPLETVTLEFEYEGFKVQADDVRNISVHQDGVLRTILRNPEAEKEAIKTLESLMFRTVSSVVPSYFVPSDRHDHLMIQLEDQGEHDTVWLEFLSDDVPMLRKRGWVVEFAEGFRLDIAQASDYYGDLEENDGWFGLELGVIVDGKRLSLIPLLVQLIRDNSTILSTQQLEHLPEDKIFYPKLPDGRLLQLPVSRVRGILGVLLELYLSDKLIDGKLKLPLLDAVRLAALEEALEIRWFGAKKLLELGRKLRSFEGIKAVPVPKTVLADLRPYQAQGLSWLQFLREHNLGGVLADDMGLGKTVQTLAHLAVEKLEKRADKPSLIIAPTSLMTNWRLEAERFTPGLRVLVLHGVDRKKNFERIPEFDIVLTTYPLVLRDIEELEKFEYHLLILDEAQNIKNARSGAAQTVASIKARHRLCLTGTPLENHLGELWSLFHFLMPGFLGDEKRFKEQFRNPIERQADNVRRKALASRIKPFLLRRDKALVASELPAKTEIIERIELSGAQRDLYETLRTSMSDRVREEIERHGLARSQIMILDALLKLRQTCCDPRLLSLEAARKAKNSAKVEWLREKLPQMLAEGRKVLIFSQFATMLGLLEEELIKIGAPYSKLTGETRDRPKQINAFQNGETDVFLISLKAGGVGLNLTAADTVIHYDPWWNPAAENQATDRAHRIGQNKPVFVYKLIAAGSLEEKILKLQERKAELARGILEGGLASSVSLTNDDLNLLFEPLESDEFDEIPAPEIEVLEVKIPKKRALKRQLLASD